MTQLMSKQYTLALPLSPDATFANYVGEAGSKLAQLHHWNLVWGQSSSGRSHLLQALCFDETGQTSRPDRIYLGELKRLEPEVLANLEMFNVVCLDDVDDVVGHSSWEEALFHLLNSCKDTGTQVVMAARLPAAQQDIKLADLRSRLNSALAVETDKLNDAQRIAVMQRRAGHWGFDLPHDVAEFILKRSPRDMVRLIDNLKRLELETLRAQRKVTIPFAKQTLRI
jgi:DnaA family protein